MDSLKSLIDKKQYDLVLSLTENAKDPESLVYRVSALLGQGKAKEALALFLDNRDALFNFNPVLTLKSNFELRYLNKEFDEAYEDLEYFSNKPYVSQEVEEYLKALPSLIRSNERNSELQKSHSPEEISEILANSDDDYEVLSLLYSLQGTSLLPYIPLVKQILISKRHPSVKTYALLLLISIHYEESVTFNKNGQVYHLIPKDLEPPYEGTTFNSFTQNLSSLAKDPSVYQIALSLLNDYIMDLYPEKVIEDPRDYILMVALIKIAQEYLHSSLGIEGYLAEYHLEADEVNKKADAISETLEKEPVLHI